MSAWLRHHAHSFARAVSRIGAAPLASLLNVLALGVVLALPLAAYALVLNLGELAPRWTAEAEVSVFLAPGTPRSDAERIGRALRAEPAVANVRFVARDAALASLKRTTGLADVIDALRENPLPDAFVVSLAPSDLHAGDRVAAAARGLAGVAHAQSDSEWVRRAEGLVGLARTAAALLGILLGIGLLAVTFNTIRLQILTEREEIEVCKLVGATDAYVRRPFLYWGALQGAFGGAAALGLVSAALATLEPDVARIADSFGASVRLAYLPPADAILWLLISAFLGWTGAALAVSKHLRATSPR